MSKGLDYFRRLQEEQRLKQLSKQDLKDELKNDHKLDVPIHSPKSSLIKAILDLMFGNEEQ